MKHTPAPWAVRGGYYVVGGNPEFLIADCQVDRKDRMQDTVNAEHIVKCVNAHKTLVAALNKIIDTGVSFPHAGSTCSDIARNALAKSEAA